MIKSVLNNSDCQVVPLQQMRSYEVVSIRRNNREQYFQKKRYNASLYQKEITTIPINPVLKAEEIYSEVFQLTDLEELIQNIESNEPYQWLRSAVGLRKLIALNCQVGNILLQGGHISALLGLTEIQEHPQIMAEAIWCLSNMLMCQNLDENLLFDSGIADAFIKIVQRSSQFDSVIYQHTVIGLGNLAAESQKIRDYLIDRDCIQFLVRTLYNCEEIKAQTLNATLWSLSNILRAHNIPPYSKVQQAVQYIVCVLVQGMQNQFNTDIITHCMFVLKNHVNPKNGNLLQMKNRGLIPFVIKLAKNTTEMPLILSCLRVIGSYSSDDKEFMAQMLQQGLMELLKTTLDSNYSVVRTQTCWILSNMAANPIQIAKNIYQDPKILKKLIKMFQNDNVNIRKEICFIFSNLCYCMLAEDYFKLAIISHLPENMVSLLEFKDDKIIIAVLRCLTMVLSFFRKQSDSLLQSFLKHIQRAKGFIQLQTLQQSDNPSICQLLRQIIKQYFEEHFDCAQVDCDNYASQNDSGDQDCNTCQEDNGFYDGYEQFKRNNPL